MNKTKAIVTFALAAALTASMGFGYALIGTKWFETAYRAAWYALNTSVIPAEHLALTMRVMKAMG